MANKRWNSPRKGEKNGFDADGASPVDSTSPEDETETVKEAGAGNGKGNGALGSVFDGIKSRARANGANGANGHGVNGANGSAPIGGRVPAWTSEES